MDTHALLDQVRTQIRTGLDSIRDKRALFRERLRLYVDAGKDRDKVSDNTIYASMQLYLAVLSADETTVRFSLRRDADNVRAEMLEALARHDADVMRLRQLNYQKDWDRLFFGVGIRVKTGWDEQTQVPRWTVKDPLSWIPDPRGNHIDPFRFHYFEEEMPISEMTEARGYDPEAVASL